MSARPLVTVGVPVYQGGDYLDAALRSIREQTYEHFELIISDNGSTDGTRAICEAHAREDARVRYHRSDVNRGSSWNFNRLVDLAAGELFKWAGHDDILRPTYLEHCVAALAGDPEAVLCQTGAITIDPHGREVREWPPNPNATAGGPAHRFADMVLREGPCFPVFGVIRRSALDRTGLLGPYNAHDRPLLAELALHGRFLHVAQPLFLNREHPDRSIRAYRGARERIVWFDPAQEGRIVFANWRLLLEYDRALRRAAPSAAARARCRLTLLRWALRRAPHLARDVIGGARAHLRRVRSDPERSNRLKVRART